MRLSPKDREMYNERASLYERDVELVFNRDIVVPANSSILVDMELTCELRKMNSRFEAVGQTFYKKLNFYVYPRTVIYKTPIRLSCSVVVSSSFENEQIELPLDNISSEDYTITKGSSLFHICAPDLSRMIVVLNTVSA